MPSVPSETIGALAVSESSLDSGTDGTGTGNSHSMTDSVRCDLLADCTAEWLSSMEALRKDLVRSVPAHCALHCFGAALRGQMGQSASKMSLYGMSKETDIIDEFWSHSWHSTLEEGSVLVVSEERGGRSCSWHGCMFGGMRIDHRRVSAQRRAVRGNFTVGHSVGDLFLPPDASSVATLEVCFP